MPTEVLPPAAIRRHLPRLAAQLGAADRQRLERVIAVIGEDGRARLQDVLTRVFPRTKRTEALTALRQFRGRLTAAANEAEIRLSLDVDTQMRTDPDQRWCWFTGDEGAVEAGAAYSENELNDTPEASRT